jgi:hypothetical protein
MMRYDSKIIIQFAQSLYDQASSVLILFTIVGVVVGGGGGLLLSTEAALIGAVILGAIGYVMGQSRASQLKLQAQLALCQVAIEENTRNLAEGALSVSRQVALSTGETVQSTHSSIHTSPMAKPSSIAAPAKPASSSGRKCRECGAELLRFAEFCHKCSARVA